MIVGHITAVRDPQKRSSPYAFSTATLCNPPSNTAISPFLFHISFNSHDSSIRGARHATLLQTTIMMHSPFQQTHNPFNIRLIRCASTINPLHTAYSAHPPSAHVGTRREHTIASRWALLPLTHFPTPDSHSTRSEQPGRSTECSAQSITAAAPSAPAPRPRSRSTPPRRTEAAGDKAAVGGK